MMKEFVAESSKREGFSHSRLPEFTQEEVEYIRGTFDYLGFNHYTTRLVSDAAVRPHSAVVSFSNDLRVEEIKSAAWPETSADWLRVTLQ